MPARLSVIWLWKDALLSVTFLSKWVHVVVWWLRTKWLLNISRGVKVLRKGRRGTKLWNIGRRWRAMMMPYLTKKCVSMQLILNRWLPTERIREWGWGSPGIFLLLKEWVKQHRFLSRSHWIIWAFNRANLCWARRLIMCSSVLVQTAVSKISVRLPLLWKDVRKRKTW